MKKVKEAREESTKERMLLSFELGKEIGEDRVNRENTKIAIKKAQKKMR